MLLFSLSELRNGSEIRGKRGAHESLPCVCVFHCSLRAEGTGWAINSNSEAKTWKLGLQAKAEGLIGYSVETRSQVGRENRAGT